MDGEQHAADTALGKLTTHFPKSIAQRPAQRHADRPTELNVFYVLSDDLPILFALALEPFANRLGRGGQFIEGRGKSLHGLCPDYLYQKWYEYATSKLTCRTCPAIPSTTTRFFVATCSIPGTERVPAGANSGVAYRGLAIFHPEDHARNQIDASLAAAGWLVHAPAPMNLRAAFGPSALQ